MLRGSAVTIASTSLAGCSGLPFGDNEGDGRRYTNWLFDAADRTGIVTCSVLRYADLATIEDVRRDQLREEIDGIPTASIDRRVWMYVGSGPRSMVLEGSFDVEEFRSEFELFETGSYEPVGEYRGYEKYETGDGSLGMALRDGAFVFGIPELVERNIDAYRGDGVRLVDAHDDVATVTDNLGRAHSASFTVKLAPDARDGPLSDGQLARGSATHVEGERSTLTNVALFVDTDTASEAGVREGIPDAADVRDVTVETDGRLVTATYTRATSEL